MTEILKPFTETFIQAHNAENQQVWNAFRARKPIRVPIIFGLATRYFVFNPYTNPEQHTFEQYSTNPDLMFELQLRFQDWSRHHILQDAELGLPKDAWSVYVDFQNYYEAVWFGAPLKYMDDQVPDAIPFLTADNKHKVLDNGIPDPFQSSCMVRLQEYHEYFVQKAATFRYKGLPVKVAPPSGAMGSDGPLTIAVNLRSPELFTDFYEDPDYVRDLLGLITDAIIFRIKSWKQYLGLPQKSPDGFGLADDSIEMISTPMYQEFVLPCHQRIFKEFWEPGTPRGMHLCGNAYRHFPILVQELGLDNLDTGYPIDFKWVRETLGPNIQINGGPRITVLAHGTPDEVDSAVKEVFDTGIAQGQFVLREANNLAPYTPLANMRAMYDAGIKYGKYSR